MGEQELNFIDALLRHGRAEVTIVDMAGDRRVIREITLDCLEAGPEFRIEFGVVSGPTRKVESIEWDTSKGEEGVVVGPFGKTAVVGGGAMTTIVFPFAITRSEEGRMP